VVLKASKHFFFEKKKQKTFMSMRVPRSCYRRRTEKSFGSGRAGSAFSSEKITLPLPIFEAKIN
jgi:hypothetical protein